MALDPVTQAAREVAEAQLAGAQPRPRRPPQVQRHYAIGDPQTTAEKFWSVLAQQGLLGPDGWLRPSVGLVSMGDHFDFGAIVGDQDRGSAIARGREGLTLLAWLSAHPREQVTILVGNHDLARVQELNAFDEAGFARAQSEAAAVRRLPRGPEREAAEQAFQASYPSLPDSQVAVRDLSSFQPDQAELMRELLLSGRLDAAVVHGVRGVATLLTHNGVTLRELELLGLPHDADADCIRNALNEYLAERVDAVRDAWMGGQWLPLDLSPLHFHGEAGQESGGLFAHRPADPDLREDAAAVFDGARPRRFHPRRLPAGLVQACGHTRPGSSARELSSWASAEVVQAELGVLRSLRVRGADVHYTVGLLAPADSDALLYMVDPHLHEAAVEHVQLLELW